MAIYYLDFSEGNRSTQDDIGFEFTDLEHARAEAFKSLSEIARDRAGSAEDFDLTIHIQDEFKDRLMEVRLVMLSKQIVGTN